MSTFSITVDLRYQFDSPPFFPSVVTPLCSIFPRLLAGSTQASGYRGFPGCMGDKIACSVIQREHVHTWPPHASDTATKVLLFLTYSCCSEPQTQGPGTCQRMAQWLNAIENGCGTKPFKCHPKFQRLKSGLYEGQGCQMSGVVYPETWLYLLSYHSTASKADIVARLSFQGPWAQEFSTSLTFNTFRRPSRGSIFQGFTTAPQ